MAKGVCAQGSSFKNQCLSNVERRMYNVQQTTPFDRGGEGFTIYDLRFTIYDLQFTIYNLQFGGGRANSE